MSIAVREGSPDSGGEALTGPDRERALSAFEVATLLSLRRAVRNLRGIFRFPVERYADKLLPSVAAAKPTLAGA